MKTKKSQVGFTLVELLVAMVIIAVIAAVAYPSYVESVRKSNRAEAKSELSDTAQRFQRCYTAFGTFKPASGCQVYESLKSGGTILSRTRELYEIKLSTTTAITDTTFLLIATAVKAPQTNDTRHGCNELRLDQNGNKTPTDCW